MSRRKKSKRKAPERASDTSEQIKKRLNAAAESGEILTAIGGRRRGWISAALGLGIKRAKQGGAPRKDDEANRARELKSQGKTWGQVKIQMNKETGQSKSQDAYRALVRSRKTK